MFEKNNLYLIKELVSNNEIESALDMLIETSKDITDIGLQNRIILNCASYRKSHKDALLDIGSVDHINMTRNKSIMAILEFVDELSTLINKYDYSNYRINVINNFQKWQNRFIHLKGREDFEEIVLFAREIDWEIPNQEVEKNEYRERREGTIDTLRKRLISDNQFQMILIGDAGMGKSTTMQYLAFNDARGSNAPLPIYIELKLLISELTIEEHIVEKYSFSKTEIIKQFKAGTLTLFLDGLNEVLPSIKSKIYLNIKRLIKDYPKIFIILSSRQQDYKNEFENVPVFALQRMNINQIEEFLQKNAPQDITRQIILNAIKGNRNWEKILGTR